MNLVLKINGIQIDQDKIKKIPESIFETQYDGNIVVDEIAITLDNLDKSYADDRVSGSLFNNQNFIGWSVDIYDSDSGITLWHGKIKTIEISNTEITINSVNYKKILSDTTCVYDNTGLSETAAKIIYNILTDPTLCNINPDDIVYNGFQQAISVQGTAYIQASYTKDDSVDCLTVINALCYMSQCSLSNYNNHISLYQYQDYDGEIGLEITESDVLAGSYKHTYDDQHLYNDYNVAYDNSGAINYATGQDLLSQQTYGKRSYLVPDEDKDSSDSSDFKLYYKSSSGATAAGALALSRYKNITKKFSLELTSKFNFLNPFALLRLNFYPFVNEPARIDSVKINIEKRTVSIEGYFVNTPTEYIERDITAPATPELVACIPCGDDQVLIKWTQNSEPDLLGYYLYFAVAAGEWQKEGCNLGYSPVSIKTPSITHDGYYYCILSQLNPGNQYHFKIQAYDTSYNRSDYSNIKSCFISSDTARIYGLNGDLVSLDLDRAGKSNWAPSCVSDLITLAIYDAAEYDTKRYHYTAIYQGPALFNKSGWQGMSWGGYFVGSTPHFRYRTSDDGSAWTTWSERIDAYDEQGISFEGPLYLQYQFLLRSDSWRYGDFIYVKNLE